MVDKQEAPHPATVPPPAIPGSVVEAQEALLGLLEPEEEKPEEEEAEPQEEEESVEDESFDEDDEEELEEEEEDDEDSELTDDEDEEELYAVTVNGEEVGVSLEELMKGYSRQSDYTRKTQEIANDRKQTEELHQQYNSQLQQIQAERQQYVQALTNVIQEGSGQLDKFVNVDWESLKENDPIEYVTKREEYREAQEKIQEFQAQQNHVIQRQQYDMQQAQHDTLQLERGRLLEVMPEWSDSKVRSSRVKELQTYARGQGFTQEELDSLVDHRSVLVLDKARKYDELQEANPKEKKLKKVPKVIRTGSPQKKSDSNKAQRNKSMKRLQQTGHIDDAISLFEDFVEL